MLSVSTFAAPVRRQAAQVSLKTTAASTGNSSSSSSTGPHFVIYGDESSGGGTGPPPADQLKGYNVYALSFLQTNGAQDKADEWAKMSDSDRSKANSDSIDTQIKSDYNAAGIKIIVSLFGGEEKPTTSGVDAVEFANIAVDWVKKYGVDGVDVDYEDEEAFDKGDGSAEAWVTTLTKTLKAGLPAGSILSHAPQGPWFSNDFSKGGGYLKVDKDVGALIDWYNIQYYNQGETSYTTCDNMLNSSPDFPGTAIFELVKAGIPMDKLVIGKPGSKTAANNGYMDTETLADCVQQAKGKGWNAGVMVWEFPEADSAWIQAVRGNAYPLD
ncbi:glycoside hydrolase family 18 protein, partial [Mycena floridula]